MSELEQVRKNMIARFRSTSSLGLSPPMQATELYLLLFNVTGLAQGTTTTTTCNFLTD